MDIGVSLVHSVHSPYRHIIDHITDQVSGEIVVRIVKGTIRRPLYSISNLKQTAHFCYAPDQSQDEASLFSKQPSLLQ